MLSVFICEDNRRFLDIMSKCISDYIYIEDYDIELTLCTSDPNEVINYIEKNKINGLYFLDVELENGDNGVELARTIRQHDPRGFISFVTSHPHYMKVTFEYQVEAMDYIQKVDDESIILHRICDCIKNAYNRYVSRENDGRYIFKSINSRLISCEYSDILFFETDPLKDSKRIILHTKKRQYFFYATIKELTSALPKGHFYKCDKSSIVNINNLTEGCIEDLIQGKEFMIMSDGTECSVAVSKKRELLKIMNSILNPIQTPIRPTIIKPFLKRVN